MPPIPQLASPLRQSVTRPPAGGRFVDFKGIRLSSRVRRIRPGWKNQVKFLEVLYNARGSLTRKVLSERTGCNPTNVTANALGYVDVACRTAREEKMGYKSLLTLGFVGMKSLDVEGREEKVYFITPEGRKAYEEHLERVKQVSGKE